MSVWLTLAGAGAALESMVAPRTLRRLLLATSLLVAFPMLVTTLGCGRARDASDYDDEYEEDRPRKKHKKQQRQDDVDPNDGNGDDERSSGGRSRSGTWYCAPSDVTACFETPAACADRAQYLANKPECYTEQTAYCYTHDLYLNATYACFASMRDCAGDQSIAKTQERNKQGTYHNVSKCQKW